eukprot:30831-Pelagococcus_subviridis.AAC.10
MQTFFASPSAAAAARRRRASSSWGSGLGFGFWRARRASSRPTTPPAPAPARRRLNPPTRGPLGGSDASRRRFASATPAACRAASRSGTRARGGPPPSGARRSPGRRAATSPRPRTPARVRAIATTDGWGAGA